MPNESQLIERIAHNIAREAVLLLTQNDRERLYSVMREAAYVEAAVVSELDDIPQYLASISPDATANMDTIARLAGEKFAARIRKLLTPANLDMETILKSGPHATREEGMCATEFAAFLAGEPHSTHPVCMDEKLRDAIEWINDLLPSDSERTTILMPLVKAAVGTAGKGLVFAPAWKAYRDAEATAWKVYQEATVTARATATARRAYQEATLIAAITCAAALLAVIENNK